MPNRTAVAEAGFASAPAVSQALSIALAVLGAMRVRYARWRTARVLQRLDDASLKDIGLRRGMLDAVFHDNRFEPRL